MDSVNFNGKNISKLKDYKSLYEIKDTFSKSKGSLSDGRILFIVPKDEVRLEKFNVSFDKNGRKIGLLTDDYLLKVLFHKYFNMELQLFICHGAHKEGQVIHVEPLIGFLANNSKP